MRCFIAVDVAAPALRRGLESAQMSLMRAFGTGDPVKWVPAHQMHITLKFLGEIPEAAAERTGEALAHAVRGRSPFDVRLCGLGAFPSAERPTVLWAGIGSGTAELADLAAAVEAALEPEGFARERRSFQPHLTLGRVREGARVPATVSQAIAGGAQRDFGIWRVDRLLLMKSDLTSRGPIYSVRKAVHLGEENT